jgi:hypothetical protein
LAPGVYFISAVFGLLHLGNPMQHDKHHKLMLAGILLGMGYYLTRELAIPLVAYNVEFFSGKVYGFPVSGLSTASSIIAIQQKVQIYGLAELLDPKLLVGIACDVLGCFYHHIVVRARQKE